MANAKSLPLARIRKEGKGAEEKNFQGKEGEQLLNRTDILWRRKNHLKQLLKGDNWSPKTRGEFRRSREDGKTMWPRGKDGVRLPGVKGMAGWTASFSSRRGLGEKESRGSPGQKRKKVSEGNQEKKLMGGGQGDTWLRRVTNDRPLKKKTKRITGANLYWLDENGVARRGNRWSVDNKKRGDNCYINLRAGRYFQ